MIKNLIIYKFFKDFTSHRKKTDRAVVFSSRHLCPLFWNTGNIDEVLQQSGKQDSFRYIFKSSASMHDSSGSQFFITTTGIQSGAATFEESRFVMTFLTILGVKEILGSFRLVLKVNTGGKLPKSTRLELFEKFLANNFALSDA